MFLGFIAPFYLVLFACTLIHSCSVYPLCITSSCLNRSLSIAKFHSNRFSTLPPSLKHVIIPFFYHSCMHVIFPYSAPFISLFDLLIMHVLLSLSFPINPVSLSLCSQDFIPLALLHARPTRSIFPSLLHHSLFPGFIPFIPAVSVTPLTPSCTSYLVCLASPCRPSVLHPVPAVISSSSRAVFEANAQTVTLRMNGLFFSFFPSHSLLFTLSFTSSFSLGNVNPKGEEWRGISHSAIFRTCS